MSKQNLAILLVEAAKISNHHEFVIAGSLCCLGFDGPDDMARSDDVDMYPLRDPDRGYEELAQTLGEESDFHLAHGFFADPVNPELFSFPRNWEIRLKKIELCSGLFALFVDVNDCAAGKLIRGAPHDQSWVTSGIRAGILHPPLINDRLGTVDNIIEYQEIIAARSLLEKINLGIHSQKMGTSDSGLSQSVSPS